jgi:hypothetical protein
MEPSGIAGSLGNVNQFDFSFRQSLDRALSKNGNLSGGQPSVGPNSGSGVSDIANDLATYVDASSIRVMGIGLLQQSTQGFNTLLRGS